MRKVQEVEQRTLKHYLNYGSVIPMIMLYLIVAPLISLIVLSYKLFLIFTLMIVIQFIVGWRVWRNGLDIKIQHRVMGFFTIFNIGIYVIMPFFFLTFGTFFFWIGLSIYLLLLGFLFTKTKSVAEGIHNPSGTKIGKVFFIVSIIIMLIVAPTQYAFTYREGLIMSLLNGQQKGIYASAAMYLMGLFLTFILPVFFYPIQIESEEHPKGRRKLSRAKRKALQEKRRK